jgi:hypothetical protein
MVFPLKADKFCAYQKPYDLKQPSIKQLYKDMSAASEQYKSHRVIKPLPKEL